MSLQIDHSAQIAGHCATDRVSDRFTISGQPVETGAVTHEYDDPFSEETVQAAVVRVLELIRTEPGQPLEAQVEMAVHEHFCSCTVDIADEIEHRRSGIHETIANEVRKRVQTRLTTGNRVDEASEESFPASDPPAWIWERHSR